jgi:hypothetical protein
MAFRPFWPLLGLPRKKMGIQIFDQKGHSEGFPFCYDDRMIVTMTMMDNLMWNCKSQSRLSIPRINKLQNVTEVPNKNI